MLKTHYTNDITNKNIKENVKLVGWVQKIRDHGGLTFIDFRDYKGIIQVVINEKDIAKKLRNEFVVQINGYVRKRPEGNDNENLLNGDIEIVSEKTVIINEAKALPIQIGESTNDETKYKYRFLDLRNAKSHNNIILRSNVNKVTRKVLDEDNFTEIETPTLTRSTPEGARDFLVPSRLNPGKFYALPQSPQLFKQLLMVGGIEKYYQICRCYRDEDFRADRQPEFTQLDIEMAFVSPEDVINISEKIIKNIWELINVKVKTPFKRITFKEAIDKYGSDKPDTRFEIFLTELTDIFNKTNFMVFKNKEYVGAIIYPNGAELPRRTLDKWQEWARSYGAKGLAYILYDKTGELKGPVAKNLSDTEKENIIKKTNAKKGDCIFFSAGEKTSSQNLLGFARAEIAKQLKLINEKEYEFLWVVDAPLFKKVGLDDDVAVSENNAKWTATHHAFTMPKKEHIALLEKNPGAILSDAYDIVCNGNEIGGGSIRIHKPEIQKRVFDIMGLSKDDIEQKFGWFINAYDYGAPPHGGIAFGWDRIVSLLTRSESIREVIAFPKLGGGMDPLTNSPTTITEKQLKESNIKKAFISDNKKQMK